VAGGAKCAEAGRRSTAVVGDRLRLASVVELPAQSPLLALWEQLGQAAARRDVGAVVEIGAQLEQLCRPRKVAS
jgi:hypothetical protein